MNRQQRRASQRAGTAINECSYENLARAAMQADQSGHHGFAELFRQMMKGGLALVVVTDRNQKITNADMPTIPTIAVVGDDDAAPTGPAGWACTAAIAEWASCAMIHAAADDAKSYAEAARAARVVGNVVLIETDTAHAGEWAAIFAGKPPTLLVWPKNGVHPVMPARETMN